MAQPHSASTSRSSRAIHLHPELPGVSPALSGDADGPASLEEAYAFCSAQASRHYENFPVGSWLLPRRLRPAVHAVYAFARGADDFADEPEHEGSRLAKLDRWERLLEEAGRGRAARPVFVALADTLKQYRLPLQPFRDLLTAFRMDARRSRYESWEDLLAYCRHSADPVGFIMLRLFGRDDAILDRLSGYLCTALQLTNFWQDLSIDLPRGRCYLPRRDLRRCDVSEADLLSASAAAARREILLLVAARTRELYAAAWPLPGRLGGALSWELRAILAGGQRVLEKVASGPSDPFRHRPRLAWRDALPLARTFLAGARRPPE